MDNTHKKGELIQLVSLIFQKHQITVEQCDNDTDTSTARVVLTVAMDDSVEVNTILCRYLFIQLCSYFVAVLTGAGKRCRCADNAGALLKYQPFTLLNHIKGLLQCQEDPRSSL